LCPPVDDSPCPAASDDRNKIQKGINWAYQKTGSEAVLNVLAIADATIVTLGGALSEPGALVPGGAVGDAVVIGERMVRVRAAAQEIGAGTFETSAATAKDMYKANMSWLRGAMRSGKEIIDIGTDPTSAVRSPWYRLEKELIERRGYPVTSSPRP
jgi:hypothetical protein